MIRTYNVLKQIQRDLPVLQKGYDNAYDAYLGSAAMMYERYWDGKQPGALPDGELNRAMMIAINLAWRFLKQRAEVERVILISKVGIFTAGTHLPPASEEGAVEALTKMADRYKEILVDPEGLNV